MAQYDVVIIGGGPGGYIAADGMSPEDAAAKWIEEKHWPTLSLVYLPHLDYNLQRLGPDDPAIGDDLRAIDDVVGGLIQFYKNRAIRVILLSEYGITAVDRAVHLNRVLREHGWITVREELGREILDCGASKAFAMADHQVAHIYLNDPTILAEVREVLEFVSEANARRLQIEAQQFLEVGQAVVAAEAHLVAEEGEQQGEGHRLGDDREIDAGDAAAEGEPTEDEGEEAGDRDDQ